MRSTFAAVLTAAAALPLAYAQTWIECDPTKETNCPKNAPFPATFTSDFAAGEASIKGWTVTNGNITYGATGAEFIINQKGESPTIRSAGYLQFGRVEVIMKAAAGTGIISSIVLQSDILDEIDWEFRGGFDSKVQTNYFGKGNTTTYDRMIEYDIAATQSSFHNYTLDWTKEAIRFIINDQVVRTLRYEDAPVGTAGSHYPQTPMNVRLGIWAGGDPEGNSPGTVEWATGDPNVKTDYVGVPYSMVIQSVKVTNYSPGCEYKYTDASKTYQSIQVITDGCDLNEIPTEDETPAASATASTIPRPSGGIFAPSANASTDKTLPTFTAVLPSGAVCTPKTEVAYVTVKGPAHNSTTLQTVPGTAVTSNVLIATTVSSNILILTSAAPTNPPSTTASLEPLLVDTRTFPIPSYTRTSTSSNLTAPSSIPPTFEGAASSTTRTGLGMVVLSMLVVMML